ncbi:MAG: YraN family protein [Comamonadaceae bacterium CG_4_9_14_3_um_filter_60_33]|nr:MAG: YraN family protein [Comamonadaceae bacterium CG_4_10_14_3_um_filter_60_42]PJB45711.1 MAG: YraN family protein [Comamonadaceae bacterium CG_4_9_14_3_um_filter_60_33]
MGIPFVKTGAAAQSPTTKQVGDQAEDLALAHLQHAGLRLLARNYRTPGRGGGEIDLIMRAPDGTCVFVEVRRRASNSHGGAAASVSWTKQKRIVFAARHFLLRLGTQPPCRFDVVAVQAGGIEWLPGAFDAGGR